MILCGASNSFRPHPQFWVMGELWSRCTSCLPEMPKEVSDDVQIEIAQRLNLIYVHFKKWHFEIGSCDMNDNNVGMVSRNEMMISL